tara:strand:- start:520 stop:663 length:144 start_codon:yes stop_codon:yes gene_type:complete
MLKIKLIRIFFIDTLYTKIIIISKKYLIISYKLKKIPPNNVGGDLLI